MTKSIVRSSLLSFVFLLSGLFVFDVNGQVAQETFGKNRVQFHEDFKQWTYYENELLIVYWYGKSKSYAEKIIEIAKKDIPDVVNLLEYKINEKFEILVFADYTDMKQSNLGIDQAFIHQSTLTKVEGNRIFVHYTGNQEDLQIQLREGIAAVLMNGMFESESIKDVVKDAVSSDLPVWFREGLVSFSGDIWNENKDLELKRLFQNSKNLEFDRLSEDHPALVGNSMWYFIRLHYGRGQIANYLYISRLNKSIDKSALYVFGIPYKELVNQWKNHFLRRYEIETAAYSQLDTLSTRLPIKNKANAEFTDIKFVNDENLVYATNTIGKVKIQLYNLTTGKKQKLFKYEYKNQLQIPDTNYPILYTKDDGNIVGFIYEKRDVLYLREINLKTKKKMEQVIPNRYQRIYSVQPLDQRYLLITGSEMDMKELFVYDLSTRQSTKITEDGFDNTQAYEGEFNGETGYYFLSNRAVFSDTIAQKKLPYENPFNLFFLNFNKKTIDTISYLSDNILGLNKVGAQQYFKLQTDGIPNIYQSSSATFDETSVFPVTAVASGVFSYVINEDGRIIYSTKEKVKKKDIWVLKQTNLSKNLPNSLPKTLFAEHKPALRTKNIGSISNINIKSKNDKIKNFVAQDTSGLTFAPVDTNTYLFQSEFGNSPEDYTIVVRRSAQVVPTTDSIPSKDRIFNSSQVSPYQLSFRLVETSMDFDNSPLFGGLNSYSGTALEQMYTPVGLLMKAKALDLFEDYKIEGGVRLPLNFNGTEVYLLAENRKKRLDKQVAFYRRGVGEFSGSNISNDIYRIKRVTTLGQVALSNPFDMFQSIKLTGTFRQDNAYFQYTNINSLEADPLQIQQLGLRLEYIFDNSIDVSINVRNGIRFKTYVEAIKRLQVQIFDPFKLDFNRGFLTVTGFDFRGYQKVLNHSVWATRIAGAISFGPEKILYITGGADQWMFPQFDPEGPAPSEPVFMQMLAPQIRGFQFNARNGSNYALINSELRVPIFKYLLKKNVRSRFINSLQLIAFVDGGSAWFGLNPFNKDNPINTVTLDNDLVSIKVKYFKDPFIMSYGLGARASLFGYFLRIDVAKGLETRVFQKPMVHLSFGYDF